MLDANDKREVASTDLTEEQEQTLDLLSDKSNSLTRESNYEMWKANIVANRPYFSKGNPDIEGLTAYIVAAGPSLEKNIDELKKVSERGVIVCLDAALRYCLYRGIKPEFCMSIDGSEKMKKMMEGCDTTGITLVCTASACPSVVAEWKGPRFFVATPHFGIERKYNSHHLTRIVKATRDIKMGEELLLNTEYEVPFEGVNAMITCGGNVSTAAHHFALQFLRVQQIVFVGLDLSWQYQSHHYAGHEHEDNTKDRTAGAMTHPDGNGGEVYTNLPMMNFKRFHEQLAKAFKNTTCNATEGGILGIGEKGVRNEFIEFLTLKEAVAKYTPRKNETMTVTVPSLNGEAKSTLLETAEIK